MSKADHPVSSWSLSNTEAELQMFDDGRWRISTPDHTFEDVGIPGDPRDHDAAFGLLCDLHDDPETEPDLINLLDEWDGVVK